MRRLVDALGAEPVVLANAIKTTGYAIAAFGVKLSPEQLGAIIVAVEAWNAFLVRLVVTPTRSAQLHELEAARVARIDERAAKPARAAKR